MGEEHSQSDSSQREHAGGDVEPVSQAEQQQKFIEQLRGEVDDATKSRLKNLVEMSAKHGRKPAATITKEYLQTNVWWWNHTKNG